MVEPWYKEGLSFSCTGCGKCCTGAPGYVWVGEAEIVEMAKFLEIEPKEFIQKYTRSVFGRFALLENKSNYDCVFLKDKLCKIYGARPQQCRKFPWWPENLESKKSWEELSHYCEGINHKDASVISFEKIKNELADEEKSR